MAWSISGFGLPQAPWRTAEAPLGRRVVRPEDQTQQLRSGAPHVVDVGLVGRRRLDLAARPATLWALPCCRVGRGAESDWGATCVSWCRRRSCSVGRRGRLGDTDGGFSAIPHIVDAATADRGQAVFDGPRVHYARLNTDPAGLVRVDRAQLADRLRAWLIAFEVGDAAAFHYAHADNDPELEPTLRPVNPLKPWRVSLCGFGLCQPGRGGRADGGHVGLVVDRRHPATQRVTACRVVEPGDPGDDP